MRAWFWTFFVFIAAVVLALVLRDHNGNVLLLVHPWRVELSLTLAILILLAVFIILHLLLRTVSWFGSSPNRFRSWRNNKVMQRDQLLLENSWSNFLEGRFQQSTKDLTKLVSKGHSNNIKALAAIAGAKAAHHAKQNHKRDELLTQATSLSKSNIKLKQALSIVKSEILLDDNRAEESLALLESLQDTGAKYHHASWLLLCAYKQLGNHEKVLSLTKSLAKKGAISDSTAKEFISESAVAHMNNASHDEVKKIWNELKPDEKLIPEVAIAAAHVFEKDNRSEEAGKILEAAISKERNDRLINAYANCPDDQVQRRLNMAEQWNKSSPDNKELLISLGALCIRAELWGKAEHYLQQSLKLGEDRRSNLLLGTLYSEIDKPTEATKYWKRASNLVNY